MLKVSLYRRQYLKNKIDIMKNKNFIVGKNIGLIGAGMMGLGVGINILKAGHNLFITQHKNIVNTRRLVESGAIISDNKYLASQCDIIFLCLPNSLIVEKVILEKNGLIDSLKPGTIIVDCTTADRLSVQKISNDLSDKNIYFLDAPLTRSPKEALEGRLNVIISGDYDIYTKVRPIVELFAENIFYAGEVGAATELKLFNNFICMSFTLVAVYALAQAQKRDINLASLDKIMSKGTNHIPAIPAMIKWIENNKENVLQFSIKNASKDMEYFRRLIGDSKIDPALLNCMVNIFRDASAGKYGDGMLPELFNFFSIK